MSDTSLRDIQTRFCNLSFGAGIYCSVCLARPWATDPGVRETYDLRRLGPDGCPSESPSPGQWFCELHRPLKPPAVPRQQLARIPAAEALEDFENLIESEAGFLEEAVVDQDDIPSGLKAFREEVTRGLASLRKVMTP
jgi:hypothetical protein